MIIVAGLAVCVSHLQKIQFVDWSSTLQTAHSLMIICHKQTSVVSVKKERKQKKEEGTAPNGLVPPSLAYKVTTGTHSNFPLERERGIDCNRTCCVWNRTTSVINWTSRIIIRTKEINLVAQGIKSSPCISTQISRPFPEISLAQAYNVISV